MFPFWLRGVYRMRGMDAVSRGVRKAYSLKRSFTDGQQAPG